LLDSNHAKYVCSLEAITTTLHAPDMECDASIPTSPPSPDSCFRAIDTASLLFTHFITVFYALHLVYEVLIWKLCNTRICENERTEVKEQKHRLVPYMYT